MKGILHGIGVGPGDPELISLRAARILADVDVILAAASPKNDHSLALAIARPHLNPAAEVRRLDFPMTRDAAILRDAWRKAAQNVQAVLAQGKNAAFLTLGDPLVYSTFSYLMTELKKLAPEVKINVVPGITAFQAAAACAQTPLCEGEEPFTLLSGILPQKDLEELLGRPGGAAILKVYRNYKAITGALQAAGRAQSCVTASYVGQPGEKITAGLPAAKPPYMTLILAGKK